MAGGQSYASLGAKLSELEIAWVDRRMDAEQLRRAGRYATAIAMGLYALEILLKVKICQRLDLRGLPKPLEIHDLDGLMSMSGLSSRLTRKSARHVQSNWIKLKEIGKSLNELRYQPGTVKNQQEADDFFMYLNDPKNGVIPWIINQS